MDYTERKLEQLKKSGNIKGFKLQASSCTQKNSNNIPKRSKEKEWLSWNLMYWSNEKALILETEYRFDDTRKWRSDWALPALKILIEYEGLFSDKSRHTTVKGFTGDTDKYNRAQALGWKVIRLTAINYKTALTELNNFLKIRA